MPLKKNQKKINKNLKKTEAKKSKINPEYEIGIIEKSLEKAEQQIAKRKKTKKGLSWIIGFIMPSKKNRQKTLKKDKPIKVKKVKAKKSEAKIIKKHAKFDKSVIEKKEKNQRKVRTEFKKQNRLIKNGYYNLLVAIIALTIALILIATAKFTPSDPNLVPADSNLAGNGFQVMVNNNISDFLSAQGYQSFKHLYVNIYKFSSAPLEQLIVGIVFLVILLPIFGGLALILLLSGYFKKWLYT